MRKRDFVTKQDCRKMPLSCMYYFFSLFILSFPDSEVQGFPSMLSTSLFVVMVVGLISVGSSMVFKTQRSVYEIAWRCTKAGWDERRFCTDVRSWSQREWDAWSCMHIFESKATLIIWSWRHTHMYWSLTQNSFKFFGGFVFRIE